MVDRESQTESIIQDHANIEQNSEAPIVHNIDDQLDSVSQVQEILTCTTCDKGFSSSTQLECHLENVHNSRKTGAGAPPDFL